MKSDIDKKAEKWIGKPVNRIDGHLKVTGGAKYSADIPLQNIAYGVMVQSTITRGKIVSFDTTETAKVPGYINVLTFKNAPKLVEKATSPFDKTLPLLQNETIFHNRQNIAVVIAETLEAATHGADLLKVNYQADPFKTSLEENIGQAKEATVGFNPANSSRGDVEKGLADADVKVELDYGTPPENHNPLEPHATIASWENGKLTIYDATQGVFPARQKLAHVFGMPETDIHVISHFVGGGFGCKGSVWSHVILTAAAAKLVDRPVKLVLTREQMYGTIGYRARTIQKLVLGAKNDGTLTAIKHDGINETSQLDEFTEYVGVMTRMMYSCPNLSSTHKLVRLDIGSPTFMRAPGESPGSWALESGLDELAYKLKMDPVQLRLKNYAETDEESGLPWSSKSLRQCYTAAAEQFGWSKRSPEPRSVKRGNKLVGWGMATATYPVMGQTAKAKARLKGDGSLLVQSGSQDIGTGTYTVMTQIAADKLSLPLEKVKFELGDTDLPSTPVSGGSMTAASVGSAVDLVSVALLLKIKELCSADKRSPLSGIAPDEMEANNGRLVSAHNPALADSYVEILKRNGLSVLEADATATFERHSDKYGMHSFGAQFAEVEVDEDLGTIHVSRFVGAFGAGKILNAKTARSQFIGGITYGIGMALTEEALWDDKFGRVMNADLAEYHLPVHADIHDIEVIMIDEVDPHINPIGVKGIGEIGIVGVAAAIGNAVYHATGVRVRELPITLDKVLV